MSEADAPAVPARPKVYIGVPTYDGSLRAETMIGLHGRGNVDSVIRVLGMSLLTRLFNTLLGEALNQRVHGVTHFLLHHADIGILEPAWLEKMMALMDKNGADVLSAVVPIKSHEGVTSTALDRTDPVFQGWHVRRYTMAEIDALPEKTWTHPDLLLNTGVMLIDLRRPWVENIWFRFDDRIEKDISGRFRVLNMPEDWLFSRDAKKLGAKLYATSEIHLAHHGVQAWPSHQVYGTLKTDRGFSEPIVPLPERQITTGEIVTV